MRRKKQNKKTKIYKFTKEIKIMNITNAIKKQKAIELMNKLDIYKPYIKGFKDKNSVCFYENFGGFWAYQ